MNDFRHINELVKDMRNAVTVTRGYILSPAMVCGGEEAPSWVRVEEWVTTMKRAETAESLLLAVATEMELGGLSEETLTAVELHLQRRLPATTRADP